MKLRSKIALTIGATLLGIQLIQPEKNQSASFEKDSIFEHHPASDEVKAIVKKACFDCHSNNTNYPWYAKVQPLAWWIDHHIEEGKGELNFSEFAGYKPKKARHKLEEVAEQVDIHEMPLNSYTWIHAEARLTDAERKLLAEWAMATREQIKLEE